MESIWLNVCVTGAWYDHLILKEVRQKKGKENQLWSELSVPRTELDVGTLSLAKGLLLLII